MIICIGNDLIDIRRIEHTLERFGDRFVQRIFSPEEQAKAERREERTTEGGLDVAGQIEHLRPIVGALNEAGIRVSMFIEADPKQLDASKAIGAPVVELHTGAYCDHTGPRRDKELARIIAAADHAAKIGLECHAGHGLTFDCVQPIAAIPSIAELNIGHFLIGEAIFIGLEASILEMRRLMDAARP